MAYFYCHTNNSIETEAVNKINIGVKLNKSGSISKDDPGHMFIYWKKDGDLVCRGYRFLLSSLPKKYEDPSTWRDYLFDNTVDGVIVDDIRYYNKIIQTIPNSILCKSWKTSNFDKLFDETFPRESGKYSFNPDTNSADNCVTWSTKIVNKFAGKVLDSVYEGRIKDMASQLENGDYRKSSNEQNS